MDYCFGYHMEKAKKERDCSNYYNYWLERKKPKVITLSSDQVARGNRKLKAVWSMEAAQDLRSVLGLNAEQELSDLLSREISQELYEESLVRSEESEICRQDYFGTSF